MIKQYPPNKDGAFNDFELPDQELTFVQENDEFKVILMVENMSIDRKDKKQYELNYITGYYLIKKK